MKNIIFDYDGVLVDTFDFHLQKVNEIYNINLTAQEYKDVHDGNFFNANLSKFEGIDFSKYAEAVSEEQGELPLNESIHTLLLKLAQNNTLHLVTSAWKAQVQPSLANHGILDLFSSWQYADNGKSKHDKLTNLLQQQNTPVENFIFITDTLGDLLEASQVGIRTIAVTFGFHGEDHLSGGHPTHIAHSVNEIGNILTKEFLT